MAREMFERWEELSFSVENKEGGGEEEEAGFQHQPHFVCVCVCLLSVDARLRRRSHTFASAGKTFSFFFIMSFFLFDIYFDSPCVVVAVVFPSVGFFFLLFLPFAEGAPSPSIHRPACYRTNTCVTSFQMVWWGDIFFSSFLATPLVAERRRLETSTKFLFFPTLCSRYNFPFSSGISMSVFFKGSEGVIIQFYADEPPCSTLHTK